MSSTAGGPPPQDAPYGALPQDHAPGREDDRVWAVLAHVAVLALPVVAALVIRLTVGRRDAFVRHHATEALNAQIGLAVVVNGLGFTVARSVLSQTGSEAYAPPTWLVVVGVAVIGLTTVSTVVGSLVGAVRAHAGVWWRYPVRAIFVRSAA